MMSVKLNGDLEYRVDGNDENITQNTSNLTRIVELELYSKAKTKDDSTEYRTVDVLDTDDGQFKWETITSIGMKGITIETELIEQPTKVEIIQDFESSIEEDEDFE